MKSNTLVKVVILIGVFMLVTFALLVFVRTIIAPPVPSAIKDLHYVSIDKDIKLLSKSKPMAFNDSLYAVLNDKIDVFFMEAFLDTVKKDECVNAFVSKYVDVFKSQCMERFNTEGWDDTGLYMWQNRINVLEKIMLSDGTIVVQGTDKADLNIIIRVINDYWNAKRVAYNCSFISIDEARRSINNAEYYADIDYIKNSDIAYSLRNVKNNIASNHFNYLCSRVAQLKNYYYMYKEDYRVLASSVKKELEDYSNNKSIYRGVAPNENGLKKSANSYSDRAFCYYDTVHLND